MLGEIEIAGEATYPTSGERLNDLRKVNYIFGHNGSGKTTISRAIVAPASRPGYRVIWKDQRPLQTLVYNCDFITANFGQQMKGIFTLGEESTTTATEIADLQAKITKLETEIANLNRNLGGEDGSGGKMGELAKANEALADACWESQKASRLIGRTSQPSAPRFLRS